MSTSRVIWPTLNSGSATRRTGEAAPTRRKPKAFITVHGQHTRGAAALYWAGMVFGHLTVTAALHREARRQWTRFPLALGPLLFGAYLPDLLDKPLNMVFGLSGHSFGHSLAVQVVFFGLLLLCWRSRRLLVGTIAIGAALHLF